MSDDTSAFSPLFQQIGRDMFLSGLVSSHAGNLSMLLDSNTEKLAITRTGSMLGQLGPDDLVITGVKQDDDQTPRASSEIWAHRAIYNNGRGMAVAHAHPAHAVALSFYFDNIEPINSEAQELVGVVPVLDSQFPSGSRARAEEIATTIYTRGAGRMVLVRGHGCFATGETLEQAYKWISVFEEACKILINHLALRTYLG